MPAPSACWRVRSHESTALGEPLLSEGFLELRAVPRRDAPERVDGFPPLPAEARAGRPGIVSSERRLEIPGEEARHEAIAVGRHVQ